MSRFAITCTMYVEHNFHKDLIDPLFMAFCLQKTLFCHPYCCCCFCFNVCLWFVTKWPIIGRGLHQSQIFMSASLPKHQGKNAQIETLAEDCCLVFEPILIKTQVLLDIALVNTCSKWLWNKTKINLNHWYLIKLIFLIDIINATCGNYNNIVISFKATLILSSIKYVDWLNNLFKAEFAPHPSDWNGAMLLLYNSKSI